LPNLKELKNRQVSVKATQKITRAMQMVAAAKLNKAQESAQSARPYARKISIVMEIVYMNSIVTAFVVVMQKLMSVMNVEDLTLMVMDYVTPFVQKILCSILSFLM